MTESLWTLEDIQTLAAALKQGVLSVEYSGPPARKITYQSTNQMEGLLARMRSEYASANGTRTSNSRVFSSKKGF